jgi:hypothetical protein
MLFTTAARQRLRAPIIRLEQLRTADTCGHRAKHISARLTHIRAANSQTCGVCARCANAYALTCRVLPSWAWTGKRNEQTNGVFVATKNSCFDSGFRPLRQAA